MSFCIAHITDLLVAITPLLHTEHGNLGFLDFLTGIEFVLNTGGPGFGCIFPLLSKKHIIIVLVFSRRKYLSSTFMRFSSVTK